MVVIAKSDLCHLIKSVHKQEDGMSPSFLCLIDDLVAAPSFLCHAKHGKIDMNQFTLSCLMSAISCDDVSRSGH